MVPLPVIAEPFHCIAMDILGPLPRSRSGNRFILVICDYATRYPEAFALRSIDAEHVVEALMTFFSRVGVPQEILPDQGTNFTSQLLAELYRLLHVKAIRTSPYHPQTDGLVERFNRTLKSMLQKSVSEEGKDWDRLLPSVRFAYREVPQSSTGFSPFELLYGRSVRGPGGPWTSCESPGKHLRKVMRVWCHTFYPCRKSWPGCQSWRRRILHGQRRSRKRGMIAMLGCESTSQGNRFWYCCPPPQASYGLSGRGLTRLCGVLARLIYEVDMVGRRKRLRVFHVNMLRKWYTPSWVGFATKSENLA